MHQEVNSLGKSKHSSPDNDINRAKKQHKEPKISLLKKKSSLFLVALVVCAVFFAIYKKPKIEKPKTLNINGLTPNKKC